MKSPVVKRSIVIAGHKTSVSLEEPFWHNLKQIAGARRMTLSELVGSIDAERQYGNLSSAIRLFVLGQVQSRGSEHMARADGSRDVSRAGSAQAHGAQSLLVRTGP